uniref:Phospholipase-like protein n=1 Tax=Tanacetum cinerariifolium TaxID=118510 RepID=A0A699IJH6_TANCI|nr:phospholipase-like protein [Tanacetum cinerariifolium]GEZ62508.1 phospholipase-like protein [Tanacetum cinerariifolium]
MFENDNDIDLKLVSDMHTMLDATGMRIRVRGEPFLEVEKQGYSPEVYESLKLLKDLRETDNAKARAFMRDLSRYNKAPDIVHLTDTFDIFLGRQGPLRARFPWCKVVTVDRRPQDADWAMVGGYFVQLLHQDKIPLWYVDDSMYKVAWSDVD